MLSFAQIRADTQHGVPARSTSLTMRLDQTVAVAATNDTEDMPWKAFQVLAAKRLGYNRGVAEATALRIIQNMTVINFEDPPAFDALVIVPHFINLCSRSR